jgi:hypothetical protein
MTMIRGQCRGARRSRKKEEEEEEEEEEVHWCTCEHSLRFTPIQREGSSSIRCLGCSGDRIGVGWGGKYIAAIAAAQLLA